MTGCATVIQTRHQHAPGQHCSATRHAAAAVGGQLLSCSWQDMDVSTCEAVLGRGAAPMTLIAILKSVRENAVVADCVICSWQAYAS